MVGQGSSSNAQNNTDGAMGCLSEVEGKPLLLKTQLGWLKLGLTWEPPSCGLASMLPENTTQAAKGGKHWDGPTSQHLRSTRLPAQQDLHSHEFSLLDHILPNYILNLILIPSGKCNYHPSPKRPLFTAEPQLDTMAITRIPAPVEHLPHRSSIYSITDEEAGRFLKSRLPASL